MYTLNNLGIALFVSADCENVFQAPISDGNLYHCAVFNGRALRLLVLPIYVKPSLH